MDRKELIAEYKRTPRPAGVFRVRNAERGISLVGSSPDLPGMLNRQRFQLEMGSHPDKELQRDWNELGGDSFVIEVLDEIEPSDAPDYDPAEDLALLADLWLDKLTAAGEAFYPSVRRSGT